MAEVHPLQLEDEQLQVVDLGVTREDRGALFHDQRAQSFIVERVEIGKRVLQRGH
jgi:hypothetical protein